MVNSISEKEENVSFLTWHKWKRVNEHMHASSEWRKNLKRDNLAHWHAMYLKNAFGTKLNEIQEEEMDPHPQPTSRFFSSSSLCRRNMPERGKESIECLVIAKIIGIMHNKSQ